MPKTVLIIDDDETILEVVQIVLEGEGFDVITNSRGDYFEKQTSNKIPDLVLLDVLLAGKSGTDICRNLKHQKKFAKMPIIILSAHTAAEVEKAAEACGADFQITKPFDIEKLIKVVKKFTN